LGTLLPLHASRLSTGIRWKMGFALLTDTVLCRVRVAGT